MIFVYGCSYGLPNLLKELNGPLCESPLYFRPAHDQVAAAIAPLRFDRALSSRRVSAGLEDDVLAYYSDRSAFLVSTACGAGVLAVLNADVARSTLPSSPVFVPLLGELATLMLGSGRPDTSVACGEASAVYVSSSGSGSLRIEGPTEAASTDIQC